MAIKPLTHKEKDEIIEVLRAKIKELSEKLDTVNITNDLTGEAIGFVKTGNKYATVKVKFNADTKAALVETIESHISPAVAIYKGKEYLVKSYGKL